MGFLYTCRRESHKKNQHYLIVKFQDSQQSWFYSRPLSLLHNHQIFIASTMSEISKGGILYLNSSYIDTLPSSRAECCDLFYILIDLLFFIGFLVIKAENTLAMDVNGACILSSQYKLILQSIRIVANRAIPLQGLSDPYTRIFLESVQEAKTRTVDKTLNPTWNETFCLYGSLKLRRSSLSLR